MLSTFRTLLTIGGGHVRRSPFAMLSSERGQVMAKVALPPATRPKLFSSRAGDVDDGDDDDDVAVDDVDDLELDDPFMGQDSSYRGPSMGIGVSSVPLSQSVRVSKRHQWTAERQAAAAEQAQSEREASQWDNEVAEAGVKAAQHSWTPSDNAWESGYDAQLDSAALDMASGANEADSSASSDFDNNFRTKDSFSEFESVDDLPWAQSADVHTAQTATKQYVVVRPVTRSARVSPDGIASATGRRKNAVARVFIRTPLDAAAAGQVNGDGDGAKPSSNSSGAGPAPLLPLGARVTGPTAFVVNGRALPDYFPQFGSRDLCLQPLVATETLGAFEVRAVVRGGGYQGQAGAVRHALARALQNWDPEWRRVLKHAGYLRRDPRMVERKKTGQPKARKKNQWSKR